MIDKSTEQFAIEEEERENIWQNKYGKKLPEVIRNMDFLLQEGTKESRLKLHDMFLDKKFFEHYKQTDAVAEMFVIMQIYEREQESGTQNGILEQGNTVEQLRRYLQQLKFILYRIDFSIDTESENELLTFIKERNTSMVVIETMMTTVVMNPMNMALKLEKIFERHCMYKEMFTMLNFINDRWPGNSAMLVKQAEIYSRMGYAQYAEECIGKVPVYPDDVLGSVDDIYEIQELLWRVRYKDEDAIKQLVDCITGKKISNEVFMTILKYEPEFGVDYYITLANAFYEKNIGDIAKSILIYSDDIEHGNEMVLCFLAQIYVEEGNIERAVHWLKLVENPGHMTKKFLDVCEKRGRYE